MTNRTGDPLNIVDSLIFDTVAQDYDRSVAAWRTFQCTDCHAGNYVAKPVGTSNRCRNCSRTKNDSLD